MLIVIMPTNALPFWTLLIRKMHRYFEKRFSSILEQFGGIFSPALEIRIEQFIVLS